MATLIEQSIADRNPQLMSMRQFVQLGLAAAGEALSLPVLAQAPRPALDSPDRARPARHLPSARAAGDQGGAEWPVPEGQPADGEGRQRRLVVTVGPVEPNLYRITSWWMGSTWPTPAMPRLFPNERFRSSPIDIPGEVLGQNPPLHAVQSVPHGELHYGYFQSKVLGTTRPQYVVYTPPGYDKSKAKVPGALPRQRHHRHRGDLVPRRPRQPSWTT